MDRRVGTEFSVVFFTAYEATVFSEKKVRNLGRKIFEIYAKMFIKYV